MRLFLATAVLSLLVSPAFAMTHKACSLAKIFSALRAGAVVVPVTKCQEGLWKDYVAYCKRIQAGEPSQ